MDSPNIYWDAWDQITRVVSWNLGNESGLWDVAFGIARWFS